MTRLDPAQAQEWIERFDIYSPELNEHIHDVLAHGRTRCPVQWSPENDGFFLVTRYDHITSVLRDDETFSSAHGKSLPHRQSVMMPPLDSDPPLHGDFRRLLNPYLSRAGLAKHREAIRELAARNVESWMDRGTCDVREDFAAPLTASILSSVILGLDDGEEVRRVQKLVDTIGRGNAAAAWGELRAYVLELLAGRVAQPPRGNILDAVLFGEVGGRPLTDDEKLGTTTVLLLGGLDTTTGAIGNIIARLTEDPALENRLRDPGWMRKDFDEFLRLDSPVTTEARYVTMDTELGGQPLAEGQYVLLHYGSANRDSDEFPDADRLVFDRESNRHIAFGLGIHRCIGSNLARITIETAFAELLSRVRDIRLDQTEPVRFSPGLSWGPVNLRVAFDRA